MEFFAASVAGVSLVSGLEWRTLTGATASEKEVVENARVIGATLYVETRNGKDITCGFLPDECRVEVPKKSVALPALLAGMPGIARDCVFVVQEDDVAVIAALRDGMPAPGFDGYGPVEEVLELASSFMKISPNAVSVYGNCTELGAVSLSLEDLVRKSGALKAARLRRVPQPRLRIALWGGLLLVVCASCLYYHKHNEEEKKRTAEQQAYVNVDEVYANSVKELSRSVNPVKPALQKIQTVLASTPVTNNGWSLSEVVCQRDGCSYVWKNDFGTNRTFVPPKKALNLTYSSHGDAIVHQLAFAEPLQKGVDLTHAPTTEQVLRDVVGDLQQFSDFELKQNFENAAGVFAQPPGLPGAPAHVIHEGAYSLSGPWYALGAASKLPDAASFDTLHIYIDADLRITFQLTGKYYVK